MLADPESVRYLGGHAFAREEAWRKMLASHAMWSLFGFGYWALELRESGTYAGIAGFADYKRDMVPSIEGTAEAGWLVTPEAQGRGYASEAMLAALQWADERLQVAEFTAIISHGSEASIRVAEKLGFGGREEALYHGEPILLFRRKRRSA